MKGTARVLQNGRITIPKPIVEALGLEHGDFVEFEMEKAIPIDESNDDGSDAAGTAAVDNQRKLAAPGMG